MRKRHLFLSLFFSSLFIPTSLDATVFDLNILKNNQKEILIATPGGHGGYKSKQYQELLEKNKEKAKESAKKRKENNSAEKEAKILILGKIDDYEIIKKHLKDVANYTQNISLSVLAFIPEISYGKFELIPFERSVIFTQKAVDAYENKLIKRAKAYANLSKRTLERELKEIEELKKELTSLGDLEGLKYLKFMELTLRAVHSVIEDNYGKANEYLLEAINLEKKASSPLKKLVPFTKILSGDIDKGCSDLEDLIVDGTIDIEDFDDNFPIEDICLLPNL